MYNISIICTRAKKTQSSGYGKFWKQWNRKGTHTI